MAGCSSGGDGAALSEKSLSEGGGGASEKIQSSFEGTEAAAQMEQIMAVLEEVAEAWDVSDVSCEGTTCTMTAENTNGDSAVVAVTVYLSPAAAMEAFDAAQSAYPGFTVPVSVADGGYAGTQKTSSQAGAVKQNVVMIIDYETPGGIGSGAAAGSGSLAGAKDLATEIMNAMPAEAYAYSEAL